ncbi:MATE family efflux transporter [Peptostreptococcus porci]|uniref:MATE family efflux transporter n=1 Tax=Peptostreptococcus porci TaxID=2652282 RepID=UPI002A8419EC|nr:MATE family efflux transporter [Peptostreptococcus porci]MDY4129333.1 MATE family efflux transporter [Peptostreptococcus porci]
MNSKISLPKTSSKNKMEVMPILPLILNMSIPPLCSMFLQYTYNFVDCIFVSWIGEDALTAVSLSFPITTLMLAMSIGIGVGINVLISKNLGGKNFDEANSVVTHGLLISTVLGIILNLIILLIIKPYFRAIIQDYAIYSLALKYMTICAFLQVPNMIHIAIQKIIQGTGNMIAPMLFQMAGVLLNFVLDPILIFGFGPFPKMGIEGAAVSTVLGYTLSMILAFYVLIFTRQKVKIKIYDFKINLEIFKNIVILGLPSFIMNALGAFMVSFANMFLIVYSTTAVAFFGAYFKAQQVVVMTVNGLIQGCIPIMSFNYGAKNRDRLLDTFKKGTIIAVLLMAFGSLLLAVFPRQVLKIFMASDSMMELGIPALRIMVCSYIFNGISTMFASLMQSIGQVKYSVYINLSRQLVLLVPFMWIFTRFWGITGVWVAFPITEILTLLFCWHIYKKQERWM